jgi:hypothetical protein
MTNIKPKRPRTSAKVRPHKGLIVTIEDKKMKTSIWLEKVGKNFKVHKVKERKSQTRN